MLTVEEAWMLCSVARTIDPDAYLAVGHVPSNGDDETFPGGFTIRGEKAPNRVGVEMVLGMFGAVSEMELFPVGMTSSKSASTNNPIGVGYGWLPNPEASWCDESVAATFDNVSCLVVQDLFKSPLFKRATWRLLRSASLNEVGHGLTAVIAHKHSNKQFVHQLGLARRPILLNLLGREGLYDPESIRKHIAESSASFAVLSGDMPAVGLDLRLQQVAVT